MGRCMCVFARIEREGGCVCVCVHLQGRYMGACVCTYREGDIWVHVCVCLYREGGWVHVYAYAHVACLRQLKVCVCSD